MAKKKKKGDWEEESEKDTPDWEEKSEIESPDDLIDNDDLGAVSDIDDSLNPKIDDDTSDFE